MDRRNTAVGYCYLVIFTNGVVKGGKSSNHKRRLQDHVRDAGKFGLKVKRYLVTSDHENYHESEVKLLRHLAQYSGYRRGEYFQDICQDNAVMALCSLGFKTDDSEFSIPESRQEQLALLQRLTRFTN